MRFDIDTFGARIFKIITSGLYDGNVNCLREYVQNGIDADAKNVRIYFENDKSDLVIRDDGLGMDKAELKEALSVGSSSSDEGCIDI